MWLWQHKNIHKRHLLWAKIFGMCFIFHLIFLVWIFCIHRDNSYILSLSVTKHVDYSTPIMFMPYTTQPIATVKQKVAPKITPVQQPKKVIPQKTTLAPAHKAMGHKAPEKKPEPITEPAKKIELVPQPTAVPAKKPEPPAIKDQTQKTPILAQALDVKQTIAPIIPENAYVSNNYREVEALRLSAQLQKELVHTWKPPFGVSHDCMCEISFFVTHNGTLENLKMIKNSGVVMYDISARQALFSMKMPQWTHGKQLNICFKQ